MKKKTKDLINKIVNANHREVSYSYGGWMFFIGRMFYNIVILWVILSFMDAFLLFAFTDNGVIDPEQLHVVKVTLWVIGMFYLVHKIVDWRVDK